MWHVLRVELAYFRPYLLGGLGLAVGVIAIVSIVFYLVGNEGPPPFAAAGIRGMFLVMAPLIVGFIAQSYRSEERRARLLLAAPITPRQLAQAMVLMPVALLGIGVVAAAVAVSLDALISAGPNLESLNIIGFVGGQLFAYTQIGLLIQEAVAAHREARRQAAMIGWIALGLTAALLAALYLGLASEWLGWIHPLAGHLLVAVLAMAVTIKLYSSRRDFTH